MRVYTTIPYGNPFIHTTQKCLSKVALRRNDIAVQRMELKENTMKIAVLGCGMVGRTIARDLSTRHDVICLDMNTDSLAFLQIKAPRVTTARAYFTKADTYLPKIESADLVVNATPGFLGFRVLESLLRAGKNVVDISFFPEDVFDLEKLSRQKAVAAYVDCGVAPGLSNMVLGHCAATMDLESFECFVGGLPVVRKKPFEYKAPFSPVDVIEEYTRPARIKENGAVVTKPALSEIELVDCGEAGVLEAFNTDGLRTLLKTMPRVRTIKEKTLRYPGHAALMEALRDGGFFSREPIGYKGKTVTPLDATSAILFKEWKLEPGDEDITVMKMTARDQAGSKEFFLFDRFDREQSESSMSRTTGFTCAAVVNAIADNIIRTQGIVAPEFLGGSRACYTYILNYLAKRNVVINTTRAPL